MRYKSWQRGVIIALFYTRRNGASAPELGHRPAGLTPQSVALVHSAPPRQEAAPGVLFEKMGERAWIQVCRKYVAGVAVPDNCSVFLRPGGRSLSRETWDWSPYTLFLCYFSRAGHCESPLLSSEGLTLPSQPSAWGTTPAS